MNKIGEHEIIEIDEESQTATVRIEKHRVKCRTIGPSIVCECLDCNLMGRDDEIFKEYNCR